jgi:intracellular sulfur oxidation DsrE/DsrF family protein
MSTESGKPASNEMQKVVFEVTTDGFRKWQGALRNIESARKALGANAVLIEVVAHGKGLGMLLETNGAENPELKAKVKKLQSEGVVFAACESTMRREKIEKKDLVEQVATVDSGVAQVIRKQGQNYAYIKIGG